MVWIRRRPWLLLAACLALAAAGSILARTRGGEAAIEAREASILNANRGAVTAHRLGEAAWARRDYQEAERGFATARRLEPRSALASLNLGLALARLGREQEALSLLREVTARRPRWGFAWRHLGKLQADAGDLPAADEAVRRATRLAPASPEAWMERSRVSLLRSDLADSEESARRALALAPDRAESWLSLGDALLRSAGDRRLAEAVEAFQRAASAAPSAYAYRRLGEAEQRAGRLIEAAGALRKAVRLAPFDASSAYQLSLALQGTAESKRWAARARTLQEDRYRLATLERRAQQSPADVPLLVQLAGQHLRLDERAAATRIYRQVLALDPENGPAREALLRLETGSAD
jgi:tetratricopeptide (TPR) repeat protein